MRERESLEVQNFEAAKLVLKFLTAMADKILLSFSFQGDEDEVYRFGSHVKGQKTTLSFPAVTKLPSQSHNYKQALPPQLSTRATSPPPFQREPSVEPLNDESHIDHLLCHFLFLRLQQHHQFMAHAGPTGRSCHCGLGWSLRGDFCAQIREISEPGDWNHPGSLRFLQIPRQTTGPNPRKTHDSGLTFLHSRFFSLLI